jgi:hypothetical protein
MRANPPLNLEHASPSGLACKKELHPLTHPEEIQQQL